MPFGLGKDKRPSADEEYQEAMAIATEQRALMPQDYVNSLGRSVYMIIDPEVSGFLNPVDEGGKPQPSKYRSMIPAFSHLNRLSNIDKNDVEILKLRYEILIATQRMEQNEDEYNMSGWAELESLKIFALNQIADAHHGWKGKLVTEQIKIIRTELDKQKKGWLR